MFKFSAVLGAFLAVTAVTLSVAYSVPSAQAAIDISSTPKHLFSQGLKLLKKRQFNKAIKKFTITITRKSSDENQKARALYNRGLAYQALGRLDQARDDYTRAIKLKSLKDNILKIVYYNRGLVHDGLKRPNAALADFASAIDRNPNYSPAYHNLGNVLRKMGKNTRAIENFLKSLELGNPQPYLTYMGLAMAYEAVDRKKAAITSLKYALDLRPRFKKASDMLARLTTEDLYTFASPPPRDESPIITGSIPKSAATEGLRGVTTRLVSDFTPDNLRLRGSVEVKSKVVQYKKLALRGALTPASAGRVALLVPGPGLKRAQRRKQVKSVPRKRRANGGFKVQLGTSDSSAGANKIWFFLRAQNQDLLEQLKATFQRVNLGKRGFLYRIQVGPFKTRQAAKGLCEAIKKRAVNCFPVGNGA